MGDNKLPYISQILEWTKACDAQHGNICVPLPICSRPREDVPTWLIDTLEQRIVPGLSAHRYLALSYVWPETRGSSETSTTAPHTLLLDESNVEAFQRSGFLANGTAKERIPMVIKHAMYLTHALGERYLWVDRLCIVQNSIGDGGTLSQVSKMDKIYAEAHLTIIAAGSGEMYDRGVDCEWPLFRTTRYRKTTRRPDDLTPDLSLDEDEVIRAMSARYSMLSRSKWAKRGWTYQEQILANELWCSSKTVCSGTAIAVCGTEWILSLARTSTASCCARTRDNVSAHDGGRTLASTSTWYVHTTVGNSAIHRTHCWGSRES